MSENLARNGGDPEKRWNEFGKTPFLATLAEWIAVDFLGR
jgi:hypothetical protein